MLHKNITASDVHIVHNWAVADATARGALSVAVADVGKVAWQQNNDSFWVLKDDSPMTWVEIGSSTSIADGDKGDITVSASGATWTIDADAVTYAKMQDVSATDKLLGRSTAGAGIIEEIACTAAGRALLDDADASAQRTTLGLAIGTDVQAYDADTAKLDVVQSWTANQTFDNSTVKIKGSSTGVTTLTSANSSASNYTATVPAENMTVGFRNLPAVGTKTGSYSLAVGDVGKYVQLGSGGAITIPDATFSEGDAIVLANNTSGNITITCSITTAYIAGTDSDKATMTLATRGTATILFLSGTVCIVSGNVT